MTNADEPLAAFIDVACVPLDAMDRSTARDGAASLLITALLLVAAFTQPALAQTPAPKDSVSRDTVRIDSLHTLQCADCGYLIAPVMAAYSAVLLVAPPLLFLWDRAAAGAANAFAVQDLVVPDLWADHVDAYVTAGPTFTNTPGDRSWAHAENLEVLRNGRYAELRLEHFYLPHNLQYETVRIGYFVRRKRTLSVGATLGYREARGVLGQSGLDIGLPLVIGGTKGWARFEPSYVIARAGTNWNFRGQGVWPIPGTRYFAGLDLEARALPLPLRKDGRLTASSASVLFGVRY